MNNDNILIESSKTFTVDSTIERDRVDLESLFVRFFEKIHWILLSGALGTLIIGLIVYFLITPIYEATSKIYIVGSDTTISLSDLQIGSNLAADYQEVFKNWHVHELVDRRLGLDYTYTELEKMISITNPINTHVIYVSVKSKDPEEAKLIADTYAQVAREFIAAKMDMREPNIFEEAKLPDIPVTPKKARDIILGFIVGVFISMTIITSKFLSDDRIVTSEDVSKASGLSTLGLIPLQEDKSTQNEADGSTGEEKRMKS